MEIWKYCYKKKKKCLHFFPPVQLSFKIKFLFSEMVRCHLLGFMLICVILMTCHFSVNHLSVIGALCGDLYLTAIYRHRCLKPGLSRTGLSRNMQTRRKHCPGIAEFLYNVETCAPKHLVV